MLTVDIPGWRSLELEWLLLDVNGTLTLDGELLTGVDDRLKALVGVLNVQLISADTFGRLDNIAAQLRVQAKRLEPGRPETAQKADVVKQLGAERVELTIGNGGVGIPVAQALGHTVIGIDSSPTMLEQARLRAAEARVSLDLRPGDMRDLMLEKTAARSGGRLRRPRARTVRRRQSRVRVHHQAHGMRHTAGRSHCAISAARVLHSRCGHGHAPPGLQRLHLTMVLRRPGAGRQAAPGIRPGGRALRV
jgi:soluble P-type ATPase